MRKYSRLFLLFAGVGLTLSAHVYAQSEIVALLTTETPTVELQRVGTTGWIPIGVESIIGAGDTIRTLEGGEATIRLLDGNAVIALASDTTLRMDQLAETVSGYDIGYTILQGSTDQSLASPDERSASFTINSPGISLTTEGGQFALWAGDGGDTDVLNSDGTVFSTTGSGLIEIPAEHGIRAYADGTLSAVTPAGGIDQLHAALDGITATFSLDGDLVLNVRQGPERGMTALGTIPPNDIALVMGISEDGAWYRIPYNGGYGWVLGESLNVAVDNTFLPIFPQNHVELPIENILTVAAPPDPTAVDPFAAYSTDELSVVAAINDWRVSSDIWPLSLNDTLTALAQEQADYLLTLPDWPDDPHLDRRGRNMRERAADLPYQWPAYGRSDRMAVGEIAYVGSSPRAAETYWLGSSLHYNTATNTSYREIGVAAVPHPLGNIYVVTLGSRPDVFPALIDPATDLVYLSEESYRYAAGGDWLADIQQFQVMPNSLSALDDDGWSAWETTADAPSDSFAVAYRGNDDHLVIYPVSASENIAWLPSNLSLEEQVRSLTTQFSLPTGNVEAVNTPAPGPPLAAFPTNTPMPR